MIEQYKFRRYFLIIDEDEVEVYPKGDFNFTWKLQETDEGLYYRREFSGNLIFENDNDKGYTDFNIVKAIESNVEVEILVKKRCSGAYTEDIRGFIDLLSGWDNDIGKLTTSVTIKDEYTEFSQNFDKEYNIYDLGLIKRTAEDVSVIPNIDYDNGFRLKDIIEYILIDLNNVEYQSDFFDAATNPVTEANPNRLNEMILYRKSDIIDPDVSATKGIVTLNKILEWCKKIFNCFPSIDSTEKFRIEHRDYYDNSNSYSVARVIGIDLTTLADGKYIRNLNRYEYDNSKVFRKEIFKFVDVENVEFVETQIEYDTVKTKENTQTFDIGDLTTDLKFLQDKPEEANSDGFFLMSVNGSAVLFEDISFEQRAKQLNLQATDYETFETIGNDQITSAIDDGDGIIVITNELLTQLLEIDQFVIQGFMTKNSGAFPIIKILDNETNALISDVKYFADGQNNIVITIDTETDRGRIEIQNPGGATNFELLDISILRNPRQNVKNGHLSWLNLLNSYHLSGRSLSSGTIFGINRTFTTSKGKNGEIIKGVPICCDAFDPEDLIKTDIGNGQIVSAIENKDGIFDFELIYHT